MSSIRTRIWNYVVRFFASGSRVLSRKEVGLIGADLTQARTTNDFFLFFNFERFGTKKLPDATYLIIFKPSGDAFKALVTLCVSISSNETIQALQLFIARSFIDDARQCTYAADLAKSFLRQASSTSASDVIGSLSTEIEAREMARSTTPVLTSQPLPSIPPFPSVAYQTYAGDSHPQTLAYSNGKQLFLRNVIRENEPVLEMTVAAKP